MVISGSNPDSIESWNGLYEYQLGGSGAPRLIAEFPDRTVEEGLWTPDRDRLVLRLGGLPDDIDRDLVALVPGETRPTPVAVVEGSEQRDASLSPDGRWLAYRSNESGRYELYVRSFPEDGVKRQISASGGANARARWSHDESELFYVNRDGLTALSVEGGDDFHIVDREILFPMRGRFSE